MHSTPQSSQNCGVLKAVFTSTCALVTSGFGCAAATQPSGLQPSGGTFTVSAPISMKHRYAMPITTKVPSTPLEVALLKWSMSCTDKGAPISAPPPKPMMANPVAMPGRSGNHLIRVETGEM